MVLDPFSIIVSTPWAGLLIPLVSVVFHWVSSLPLLSSAWSSNMLHIDGINSCFIKEGGFGGGGGKDDGYWFSIKN